MGLFWKSRRFRGEVKGFVRGDGADIGEQQYRKVSGVLIATGLILYIKLMVLNTINMELLDQDFSYFDLMIANFMEGKDWYSEACNCNHMGVHSSFGFICPFELFGDDVYS